MTKQKKSPEISIIVPVYKVEKYLNECIDSILAQTFTDFELILVDDGSPDNCPALCDAAAEKDSRVRVIHQQNKGLSGARNAGIDVARGNWLSFIDSDDTVEKTFCEKLYRAATESGAELAACNMLFLEVDGSLSGYQEHPLRDEVNLAGRSVPPHSSRAAHSGGNAAAPPGTVRDAALPDGQKLRGCLYHTHRLRAGHQGGLRGRKTLPLPAEPAGHHARKNNSEKSGGGRGKL